MADVKRQVIGDTPLPTGRIVRLACEHKQRVQNKIPTQTPEIVVCDECTAIDNAISEHIDRTDELKLMVAGHYGGFWD